jgi:hypothetical protein
MSTPKRGLVGADEPIMFSESTEVELRAEAVLFAHLLVRLIPGYDFTNSALYQRASLARRRHRDNKYEDRSDARPDDPAGHPRRCRRGDRVSRRTPGFLEPPDYRHANGRNRRNTVAPAAAL